MKLDRVLLPLDGSTEAERILALLEPVAGPLDLELVLVRVVPETRPLIPPPPALGEHERVERLRDARRYLDALVARLEAKGIRVRAQVRVGAPPAEIVAAAEETGADLIAMTTHGRGGLGRLLFGSVAESVLRLAAIPVIFLKGTDHGPAATGPGLSPLVRAKPRRGGDR